MRRLPSTSEATIRRAIDPVWATSPSSATPATLSGPPSEVSIPSLGESAPVQEVAPKRGVLSPPSSPLILAWSDASRPAGASSGTTLIVGHINWAGQAGVFSNLSNLSVGSLVRVQVGSTWLGYRVVASGQYLKGTLPPVVFATSGAPALALVTCGGTFDYATGHYDDNVVVMAVPLARAHL